MNKAFLLSLGTAVLIVGCKKDEIPPPVPPPTPAPVPQAAVAPAPAPAKLPAAEPATPTLTAAPTPAPIILATPPPAAPVAPALPKDTSLVATTTEAVKQGARDTFNQVATNARASVVSAVTNLSTSSLTNLSTGKLLKQGALDTLNQVTTNARASLLPLLANPATPVPPATPAASPNVTVTSLADLSTDQMTRGLKEALAKGLQQSISSLGHSGGFMTNLAVKIPMPEKLQSLEKTLRALHQDRLADDFVATMNQAAEQAVPAAADVFTSSLSKMTVEDARKILTGTTNAATQYFRQSTEKDLKERFLPIVQKATAATGVTAAYKNVLDRAKLASPFLGSTAVDVDGYVTDKALDGLFTMVAAEEKRIRENPVARTTDLLKSVFGALGR